MNCPICGKTMVETRVDYIDGHTICESTYECQDGCCVEEYAYGSYRFCFRDSEEFADHHYSRNFSDYEAKIQELARKIKAASSSTTPETNHSSPEKLPSIEPQEGCEQQS